MPATPTEAGSSEAGPGKQRRSGEEPGPAAPPSDECPECFGRGTYCPVREFDEPGTCSGCEPCDICAGTGVTDCRIGRAWWCSTHAQPWGHCGAAS
jgi:hypothetical protein